MKDYKPYIGTIVTRSGKKYPDFALGTYLCTEEELSNILQHYPYDRLMLDTAFRYGNEREVAKAVMGSAYPQNQIIYIGKINTSQQESGRSIKDELMDTLHRLNISKIDIYLIHSSRYQGYFETWRELIKLQKEGLIETIGVSNFGVKEIENLYDQSGVYPEINQIVVQRNISTDEQNKIQELIGYCCNKNISIQIAMPFGGPEISKKLSEEQRASTLENLRKQKFTCVFGTKNILHLLQNIRWIEMGW